MKAKLINVNDAHKLMRNVDITEIYATTVEGAGGYLLNFDTKNEHYILSNHPNNKAMVFTQADSLLCEAQGLNIEEVAFRI